MHQQVQNCKLGQPLHLPLLIFTSIIVISPTATFFTFFSFFIISWPIYPSPRPPNFSSFFIYPFLALFQYYNKICVKIELTRNNNFTLPYKLSLYQILYFFLFLGNYRYLLACSHQYSYLKSMCVTPCQTCT